MKHFLVAMTLLVMNHHGEASAADYVHVARAGDTLETLAKQYYGASWKSVYLAAKNELQDESGVLMTGTQILIPGCITYRVRRGDSLATITKRFLGSTERYKILMQENDLRDPTQLEIGQPLLLPFVVKHTVQSGEGLSHISRRYYRTTKKTTLLSDWNGMTTLNPGDKVSVPIFDSATLDPKSRRPLTAVVAVVSKQAPPATQVTPPTNALSAPLQLLNAGEFEIACKQLDRLLSRSHDQPQEQIILLQHLGLCAVAEGDMPAAHDYFNTWLALDPNATLDPIMTSPKILAVFHEAEKSAARAASPSMVNERP